MSVELSPRIVESSLTGKRIVVTRAAHQASEAVALIRQYGAEPVLYPCIAIVPPEDSGPLDAALQAAAAGQFDWLVITSANTAWALAERLAGLGLTLPAIQVAAVGPKTSSAVRELLGRAVDLLADEFIAEGLAEVLQPVGEQRILLPQSEIARPALADGLRAAGAEVTAVTAYRTVIGQGGADVPRLLAERKIEAITFTSSSTARFFLERLAAEGGDRRDLDQVCLVAIGPATARTMVDLDLPVTVMPADYTLEGLLAALNTYFAQQKN